MVGFFSGSSTFGAICGLRLVAGRTGATRIGGGGAGFAVGVGSVVVLAGAALASGIAARLASTGTVTTGAESGGGATAARCEPSRVTTNAIKPIAASAAAATNSPPRHGRLEPRVSPLLLPRVVFTGTANVEHVTQIRRGVPPCAVIA